MRSIFIAAGVLAVTATVAEAQTDKTPMDVLQSTTSMAPLDRAISPFGGVQVQGAQSGSTASLTASLSHSSGEGGNATFDVGSLTFSAPISSGSTSTNILNLRSLAGSTNGELKWTHLLATGALDPTSKKQRLLQICDDAATGYKTKTGKAAGESDGYSGPGLGCSSYFVSSYAPEAEAREYAGAFWRPSATIWLFGLDAKLGEQSFTYYNASSLAKTTQDRQQWNGSAFAAFMPKWDPTLFVGQFTYGRVYMAGTNKVLCPSGTGVVSCVNGAIGAPTLQTTEEFSLEARRTFGWIALAPQVGYDVAVKTATIDVPVYFFQDGKNGLTGGLRYEWTSKDHQSSIGIFITKAFSIFDLSS